MSGPVHQVKRQRGVAFACSLVCITALAVSGCGSSSTTASGAPATSSTAALATATTAASSNGTALSAFALEVVKTPYGDAIGTTDGLVVYAWDKEADGSAVCVSAACLEKWPPLLASTVPGATGTSAAVALVDRPDGTKQVALGGKRLYHMAIDRPGEANCQGAEGWWILHPDGSKNTSKTPSTAVS